MKVQCLIRRLGGTRVEIGGTEYHFVPDVFGRHVCEVKPEHVENFRRIRHTYVVLADPKPQESVINFPPAPKAPAPIPPEPRDVAKLLIPEFPKWRKS